MSLSLLPQSLYLGIDPGLAGAIVGVDNNLNVLFLRKTPVFKQPLHNTRYDLREMWTILRELRAKYEHISCYIEKSQSRPTDSRRSAWTTGCGFGFWQMALTAADIPYGLVPPKKWQTAVYPKDSDLSPKELSVLCAKQIFPKINLLPTPRSRKEDHNISDAALIALYCINESRR